MLTSTTNPQYTPQVLIRGSPTMCAYLFLLLYCNRLVTLELSVHQQRSDLTRSNGEICRGWMFCNHIQDSDCRFAWHESGCNQHQWIVSVQCKQVGCIATFKNILQFYNLVVKFSTFLFMFNYRISDTSIEAFILKLFRERNRLGFIKAFSEDPEQLHSGFGKVERLMRVLFVKKLYLWPRFRMEIVQALSRSKEPEVVELATSLTANMKSIQSAILVAMKTCIQELKKAAPHLETSQMTLENGLFHAFDYSIKRYQYLWQWSFALLFVVFTFFNSLVKMLQPVRVWVAPHSSSY